MAFADWKSKKLQAAIVAISAIDEVITPVFSPTIEGKKKWLEVNPKLLEA